METYAVGIDIGGTNFRIGTVDGNGKLYDFQKYSSVGLQGEDGLRELAKTIKTYRSSGKEAAKSKAVAIGVPATVSKDKRVVYSASYFKGFSGKDMKGYLEGKLGCPVYLDRDANFLLLNDMENYGNEGCFSDMEMVAGLYYGTAVANAFYTRGAFYDGCHGAAGEISHNPLYGITDRCQCGKRGCMAVRNGGRYLQKLAKEQFGGCSMEDIFEKHGQEPCIRRFVEDMAIPIVQIANILDPDLIFLGGGVTNIKSFPWETLNRAVRENTRGPVPAENLNMVHTVHTSASGVLGAGLYAVGQLEKKRGERK